MSLRYLQPGLLAQQNIAMKEAEKYVPIMVLSFTSHHDSYPAGGVTRYFIPGLNYAIGDNSEPESGARLWKSRYAGYLKNFFMVSYDQPGIGETFIFTIYVNDVVTAMVVTFSDNTYSGSDTTHILPVAVGDTIYMKMVVSSGSGGPYNFAGTLELNRRVY